MRNALPKDIPECLKRQYPRFTTIKASLVIALGIVYIVFSQVYHHDSFGVRAAFFASYIIVIIWAFLPVMMGDRGLKRLVRRAVDEQFEMCCACGYSIPPGARVCPECGASEGFCIEAWQRLTFYPDGTVTEGDEGQQWDPDSACCCESCLHEGVVGDFLPDGPN